MLKDSDLALQQDVEVIRIISVAEQHVADRLALFSPIAVEDVELLPAQGRPAAG
jgi:hypothetical protein